MRQFTVVIEQINQSKNLILESDTAAGYLNVIGRNNRIWKEDIEGQVWTLDKEENHEIN